MSFVSVSMRVSSITSAHTHSFSFFFSSSSSPSFLRVELLTLVRRTGMEPSYHLSKCVCVHFFSSFSSNIHFLLELIVISDT